MSRSDGILWWRLLGGDGVVHVGGEGASEAERWGLQPDATPREGQEQDADPFDADLLDADLLDADLLDAPTPVRR